MNKAFIFYQDGSKMFNVLEYDSSNDLVPKSNICGEETIHGTVEELEIICDELNSCLVHDVCELENGKFMMCQCTKCKSYFKFTNGEYKQRQRSNNRMIVPNKCRKHRAFNGQFSYRTQRM